MGTRRSEPDAGHAAREGGCLCGRIRFAVGGEPDYPHVCSCRHCQKRAGGPLQSWVSFPLNELTWIGPGGEPTWFETFAGQTARGFCPSCGSHIAAFDHGDAWIGINITALDEPDESCLVPVNQSFRGDAVRWLNQVPDTQHVRAGSGLETSTQGTVPPR